MDEVDLSADLVAGEDSSTAEPLVRCSVCAVVPTDDRHGLVRRYLLLHRWSRARGLTLTVLIAFGCSVLAARLWQPSSRDVVAPLQNIPVAEGSSSGRAWSRAVIDCRFVCAPNRGWPGARIDRFDDGSWIARDVMAIAQNSVGDDTRGASISALGDWADRVCDEQPHTVILFGFSDEASVDAIAETLVETCPSLQVRWGTDCPSTGCY